MAVRKKKKTAKRKSAKKATKKRTPNKLDVEEEASLESEEGDEMEEGGSDEETSEGEGTEEAGEDTEEVLTKSASRKKADVRTENKLKRGLFSLELGFGKKKEKDAALPQAPKGKVGQFFASINNMGMGKQRVAMIQSLAMMMNAGLPLIDALSTLAKEVKHRATRKIVQRMTALVESGVPLWRAMEQQYLFTPYELALVRIGEEAGNLARNLEYLSEQQEKDRALKSKVKMAMIYPTIVMILMFIIVMGLGLFVLPNLIQVLLSLNAELPITTKAVIYITNIFSEHGMVFVPSMVGGFLLLIILSKYTAFRAVSQWFLFRIPGIGTLGRTATIARFGVILGGLLRAGVPLVEALESLENVTHVVAYKKFYRKLLDHITQGDSFSKSFEAIRRSHKLLPVSVQQLVVTGEQSGTLSETLIKIADIYEKKAEETAEKLPVILEPMLLLFIGGLVGTIAFAIITPIYSVVGNVGR